MICHHFGQKDNNILDVVNIDLCHIIVAAHIPHNMRHMSYYLQYNSRLIICDDITFVSCKRTGIGYGTIHISYINRFDGN